MVNFNMPKIDVNRHKRITERVNEIDAIFIPLKKKFKSSEEFDAIVKTLDEEKFATKKDLEEVIDKVFKKLHSYCIDLIYEDPECNIGDVFNKISGDLITKILLDPDLDIIKYIKDREKSEPIVERIEQVDVLDQDGSVVSTNTEQITEETIEESKPVEEEILTAAKDPVSPIKCVNPDGTFLVAPGQAAAAAAGSKGQENPRPVKGKDKKDKNKKDHKHDHNCSDPNCNCDHTAIDPVIANIVWPANIFAYFDINSLTKIEDINLRYQIGCRISKAFSNLDTLNELTAYLGDVHELPFGFTFASMSSPVDFVLTADRTINGKFTKLYFTFSTNGGVITAQ